MVFISSIHSAATAAIPLPANIKNTLEPQLPVYIVMAKIIDLSIGSLTVLA